MDISYNHLLNKLDTFNKWISDIRRYTAHPSAAGYLSGPTTWLAPGKRIVLYKGCI